MSSVKKLSIQGIRSFSCESPQSITFGTPLTLICGENGCGKTTIIECLKYATTGMLPPNSKGGAFINDPNISRRNPVTAQIKLYFTSVDGTPLIITRTMQLSKKGKDKYTFKTLENQLERSNNGEKTSVSAKSSDIDSEIPISLGISKPILDYVLFCHQDESLWPLSEPSILKKKFDDIFEASKFTKILDNLKTINKDLTVDVKLLEKSVEHLKIDKKRSSKIVDNLNDLKSKINTLNEEIAVIATDINANESTLNVLYNSNQEFQEVLSKYDQLKFTKSSLQQQLDRLNQSIEKLPDEPKALLEQLSNFDSVLSNYKSEISKLSQLNDSFNKQIQQARDELDKFNTLQGTLNFKRSEHEKNLQAINIIVGDEDLNSFRALLESQLSDLSASYKKLKQLNQKIKDEKSKGIAEINEQISNKTNSIIVRKDSVKELQKKINDLNQKIESLGANQELISQKKEELKSSQEKYDKEMKSDFLKKLQLEIAEKTKELLSSEELYDKLNEMIQTYNSHNDLINKITFLKDTETQLERARDSNLQKLQVLVPSLEIANYEKSFNDSFGVALKEFEDFESQKNATMNEKNNLENSIGQTTSQLKKLEGQFRLTKEKILKVISEEEIETFDEIIKEAEEDLNIADSNLKTLDISKKYNMKALDTCKESNDCLLCKRKFNKTELRSFIEALNVEVKRMESGAYSEEYEEAKKEFDSLKSIQMEVPKYATIQKDITELKESDKKAREKLEEITSDLEQVTNNWNSCKDRHNRFLDAKHILPELNKLLIQIKENNNRLDSANLDFDEAGIDENLSIDELNKLSNDTMMKIKNLRASIDKDKEISDKKEKDINKLSNSLKDKQIEINNLENGLHDIKNFQDSLTEHTQTIEKYEQEIKDTSDESTKLKERKSKLISDNELTLKEFQEHESSMEKSIDEVLSKNSKLSNLIKLKEDYEQNDTALLLENQENIRMTGDKLSTLQSELKSNAEKIRSYEGKMNESNNQKAIIRDNIDYHSLTEELERTELEIKELNIDGAEEQKEKYQIESKRLREVITELNSDNAFKIGQVKQIKEQIKSMQQELSSEYKDVDKNYHEEWIKLQTNKLVSTDIATYSKAVDSAIMKYHSIKMEHINKSLRYLWSMTYKGTDIDSIAIKSDVNTQSKGNRTYNYRVVMRKGDVELDMRGRCSAGQRVLTSILIRLALAECFGSRCGIIALDEPTTNLDDLNAKSLAESLNSIIQLRSSQFNFQIIIITHDQHFLSHINASSCNNFFKVERGFHQESLIKAIPIRYLEDSDAHME